MVNATGGGSYKYAEIVKEKLKVTFKQHDEMKCLIRGLNFLLLNVEHEAFHYDWKTNEQTFISGAKSLEEDSSYPFPYLLVNIGSGVSVLKVESDDKFERVSGSSIGGGKDENGNLIKGTFWGLCKLLTDIQSFDQVKELSSRGNGMSDCLNQGDSRNVDLMVGDIYGSDYSALGLGADVIASRFDCLCFLHLQFG